MTKLAILIPIYNALRYTKQSLENLKHFIQVSQWEINKTIEIVVIDDGSTDGSSEWIKTNFPEVVIVKGDGNLWWSGAINKGSKHAVENLNCSYLLLWNNDIESDNDYFINLYKLLNDDEIHPVIGSKVFIKGGNTIWSMGGIFNPLTGVKKMIGFGEQDSIKFNTVVEADWITGMGTIIHKSVIEKIGYWDEIGFPQYHGDSDYTLRAKAAGFKLYIYPDLKIWNNIENTGLQHSLTFKTLKTSLTSIKSDFNFRKDVLFYQQHSAFFIAYVGLFWKYFKYVGGFFKHKLLKSIKT
jgi:GT2 family glycosyltransferase